MHFSFETEKIDLPKGALAKTHRRTLRWRGKTIASFTQGLFRAYLYPLYTPAGYGVTSEAPADHPHHNSIWVAADHLHCRIPLVGDLFEEATYCFYVNETFQGRAPGRIIEEWAQGTEHIPGHFRVTQRLNWRGPSEWGAEHGRVVAIETRTTNFQPGEVAHVIDIRSQLEPTEWDLTIGPTRHAYFGVRVAESIRVIDGGRLVNAEGHNGGDVVTGAVSDWIDLSGPVTHHHWAGITVMPDPQMTYGPWFATDWGTVAVNPFVTEGRVLPRGEKFELGLRLVVHDGDLDRSQVSVWYETFAKEGCR
ncbi:MAG: PmoA family protein [Deltaproteobacteria bacterium]|nr:PmoA family protein [Deltaproteobacteria bacterium]